MIILTREQLEPLVAAGLAMLPMLVCHGDPRDAWRMSEALNAAEAALLADDREDGEDVVDQR